MEDTIIRKAFMNKRTKQFMVSLPKKEMKTLNPKIKFNKDILVELKVLKKRG